MAGDQKRKINRIYRLLLKRFGDPEWWPAETPFEVMVGAVLTQNTAWSNVEKAIIRLKDAGLLDPRSISEVNASRLAALIRPAGYYRIKSRRIKAVSRFLLSEYGGRVAAAKKEDTGVLRKKLLSVHGVGPETADSILIYALGKPVFVVDAYTRRIFSRHGLVPEDMSYDGMQELVHACFPKELTALNRYHALIVQAGKLFCRKSGPLCDKCPLKGV